MCILYTRTLFCVHTHKIHCVCKMGVLLNICVIFNVCVFGVFFWFVCVCVCVHFVILCAGVCVCVCSVIHFCCAQVYV